MKADGESKSKKSSLISQSTPNVFEGNAALALFHPVTAEWFRAVFDRPTAPQRLGWPVIARGESTLILAPTGTGKTLTAFLWCLDRITKEKDGIGIVLGGKPLTYAEMAESLGVSERSVRRNMDRLYFAGYIELIRTPRGQGIRVLNSCKFGTQHASHPRPHLRVIKLLVASNSDPHFIGS